MRARNLKPSFFKNDLLAELPYEGRLLFAGLWCLADRAGRLEDRPKRIKGELFAFDSVDIDKLLDQLHRHGFIKRYEVGGARFIWIPAFLKHQHPHHQEKESVLPPHSLDSSAVPSTENPGFDDDAQNENLGFDVDASNKNPGQARGKPGVSPPLQGGQIGLNPESGILNPDSKHLDRSAQQYAPEFESFWREYPRKIGKGAAYKAWGKLKPPLRDCLSALQWQKKSEQWTKEQGQFIPHPATWLNQRRWEDEKPLDPLEAWAQEA